MAWSAVVTFGSVTVYSARSLTLTVSDLAVKCHPVMHFIGRRAGFGPDRSLHFCDLPPYPYRWQPGV